MQTLGVRQGWTGIVFGALALVALVAVRAEGGEQSDGGVCADGMTIEAVAREGDPAPGTGDVFQSFARPVLGPTGSVFFGGDTDGQAASDEVLYLDAALVAREGDVAPGTGNGIFGGFPTFDTGQQINAGHGVVYLAEVMLPLAGSSLAVYRSGVLIAIAGAAAPGIPDRNLTGFSYPGIADDGAVGFIADLDGGGGDDSVIYLDDIPLYRQGGPVPGMDGETWDGDFNEIAWNGRGDMLFEGNTSLPTAMDVVAMRRLRGVGGSFVEEIVAQEGQAVAARGGTDFLDQMLQMALADNGSWALRGSLELAPADESAVILSDAGFSAQEGDAVPELPGAQLGNFAGLDVNSTGDVVYLADLVGAAPEGVDEGIFINGCLLVTDGTQVPGLPEGTLFSDLGFQDLFINNAAEIVFAASYSGAVTGDGIFRISLPAACRADVDGTGTVDFADVLAVLLSWGACPPGQTCPTDLDGNGRVDSEDLVIMVGNWGPCPTL